MIYYTADTHFSSQRTCTLSERPFKNAKQMDQCLIANWNKRVSTHDTVYHLGDFGRYEVRPQLNGKIVLLLGNHELDQLASERLTITYLRSVFDQVIVQKSRITTLERECIALIHEPEHAVTGLFHLFGHIHKYLPVIERGLNVGVDYHHFRPVSQNEIMFYKEFIEKEK